MGVTVPEPPLTTYAVLPSGEMAMATGPLPTAIGVPAVMVRETAVRGPHQRGPALPLWSTGEGRQAGRSGSDREGTQGPRRGLGSHTVTLARPRRITASTGAPPIRHEVPAPGQIDGSGRQSAGARALQNVHPPAQGGRPDCWLRVPGQEMSGAVGLPLVLG